MQPPRYMTRSNSMAREKRSLDTGGSTVEGQPQRKRPAFSSVVVEALKVDNLQRLCSSLEPILRRVVSEEVERALAKLGTAKTGGRASPPQLEGPDGRNLRLQFRSCLSLPLFTGGRIEGEQGAAVHIVLMDANNGRVVTYGPESSVKINVVVLEGDFNNEENDNWTEEEFESYVVKEREGKRPLLTGDLQVTLKEGVGTLGEVTFTDNSSWIRSRKFRLGLKVASGCCEGIRIREAKTEPFSVKDHRGELYKKHYPPALTDEVWRLEKIGKDGAFHKRLTKHGIFTVKDFLRLVVQDSQRLRNILGSGMSTKMWDALVEHAKTCAISGKLYVYYSDDARDVGVVFNNIYVLCGLIAGGQYYSADSLSDGQRGYVDNLVKKAYENWMHVVEYDGESLLSFKQNKILGARQSEDSLGQQGYLNSFDHLQTVPCLPASVDSEPSSRELGLTARGYNGSLVAQYPMQPQDVNPNAPSQLNGPSFPHDNQLISASDGPQLLRNDNALVTGFLGSGTSNSYSFRGVEGFSPEEEIRMRSHEMLGSEDMQHLLRLFNDGSDGHSSMNVTEDGLPFPSAYMPIPSLDHGFNNHQVRSSGKAVVGWLKLKAALRWGIFIRKKAAERRAQLVELN